MSFLRIGIRYNGEGVCTVCGSSRRDRLKGRGRDDIETRTRGGRVGGGGKRGTAPLTLSYSVIGVDGSSWKASHRQSTVRYTPAR